MRRLLYFLPACVFLMIAAAPAFAVIDNTHHDMNQYLSGSFSCYACHGFRLGSGLTSDNNLGTVGSFCYNQCHRGSGGIAGAIPVASDFPNTGNENGALWPGTRVARGAIYNGGSASVLNKYGMGHGRNWSNMPTIDNATKPAQTNNWPHVGSGDMQCTGCHDVHSNTYAPFLRAHLSIGTGAGSAAATFCVQCHTGSATSTGDGRWVVVTANANGAHPIETDSATAATRTGGTPTRHGRLINIKGTRGAARNDANDNSSIFKALSLFATGLGASGLGNPANHYRPGGKLGAMNTPADNGAVICITCHGIHLPSNVAGTNNLTYVSIGDQSGDNEPGNPICIACHGPGPTPTGTSNANPGVSSYYHPVNGEALSVSGSRPEPNYTASTGSFTFAVNVGSGAGASDLGVNLRLVCTSCHTYGHGGPTGTMLLTTRARTCGGCHNTTAVQTGSAANSHHRYGGSADYTQAANGGYTAPSYAATNPTVNLTNGLGCEDCHVFNSTAHNW